MKTIGFIGAGNMGGAMAKACARLKEAQVWIYDTNQKIYDEFKVFKGIECVTSIEELMRMCEYIVISVKPQYYESVARQMKAYIKSEHIIITVAPSFTLEDMRKLLGESVCLIRTMPNTPALIGQGVTAYCYDENQIKVDLLQDFITYFQTFGTLIKVEEHLMPAVVATTGSSPAYVYLFIEAMADAAVSMGMPRPMAYQMASLAVKGSAEMILQTGKHPGELKDAVTSPAGTTIKAVLAMEESGFRNSVIKGMEACYKQVMEMSKH